MRVLVVRAGIIQLNYEIGRQCALEFQLIFKHFTQNLAYIAERPHKDAHISCIILLAFVKTSSVHQICTSIIVLVSFVKFVTA